MRAVEGTKARACDAVDIGPNQLGGKSGQSPELSLSKSRLDYDVSALDMAQLGKTLSPRAQVQCWP